MFTCDGNETKAMFLQTILTAFQVFVNSQQQYFSCSSYRWLIWRDFVFSWRTFHTGPSSNRLKLILAGPAPEVSETSPSLFFESVLCKLKQGFEWEAISSSVGLTSYWTHAISLWNPSSDLTKTFGYVSARNLEFTLAVIWLTTRLVPLQSHASFIRKQIPCRPNPVDFRHTSHLRSSSLAGKKPLGDLRDWVRKRRFGGRSLRDKTHACHFSGTTERNRYAFAEDVL